MITCLASALISWVKKTQPLRPKRGPTDRQGSTRKGHNLPITVIAPGLKIISWPLTEKSPIGSIHQCN